MTALLLTLALLPNVRAFVAQDAFAQAQEARLVRADGECKSKGTVSFNSLKAAVDSMKSMPGVRWNTQENLILFVGQYKNPDIFYFGVINTYPHQGRYYSSVCSY